MRRFLEDTRAADTIPMKLLLYLVLTGAIIILLAVSWNGLTPFIDGYKTKEQVNGLIVELLSIQNGHARNIHGPSNVGGSTCCVHLSLPDTVSYIALGVDPDPDNDRVLNNSMWLSENNTVLVQYKNGKRDHFVIKGHDIKFRKGVKENGIWTIESKPMEENLGIVIERPIDGEYTFELVLSKERYTLSQF